MSPHLAPQPSPRWPRTRVGVVVLVWLLSVPAAAVTAADPVADVEVVPPRIAGGDRAATSRAVAAEVAGRTPTTPRTILVAPQDDASVAVVAGAAAAVLGVPLLLSPLPPDGATAAAIAAAGAATVVLAGGGRDDADVLAATARVSVTHLSPPGGPSAVAASLARFIAEQADVPDTVVIAGAAAHAEALAGTALAGELQAPMLLTAPHALDPHTRFVLDELGASHAVLLGGEESIARPIARELVGLGLRVRRVVGPPPAGTPIAIAEARGLPQNPGGVVLLLAPDAVDAAGAGTLAVRTGAVLLPHGPQTEAWLASRCGTGLTVRAVGGPAAVPEAVLDAAWRAAQRCEGVSRAMEVGVAVAAPTTATADPTALAARIAAIASGPEGWSSRRVRLVGVAADHDVGIVVADGLPCGAAVGCRRGRDLLIHGGWAASAPHTELERVVHLLLGSWLGEPLRACDSGAGVMRPSDCADARSSPSPQERDRVAARFVPTATLAFAGDVHAERHIASRILAGDNPLAPVAPILSAADVAVVNLETPLSRRGRPAVKRFTFRGPPEAAAALVEAGVDLVTLANNHALDYGVDALVDTLVHAESAGLATVGAGLDAARAYSPWVVDTPAGRIAVVGLTRVLHTRAWEALPGRPGLASAYDEPAAVAAVRAAADTADVVVVAIHWGTERADCPDGAQRRLATLLTEAGADLIVGHHPHVLQGVEVRGDPAIGVSPTLIAYSLGNFVWYHDRFPSNLTGVLQVQLPLLEVPRWELRPAVITDDGSPRPVEGALAASILSRVAARSPGGTLGCG